MIVRSRDIPTVLNRAAIEFHGVEGQWRIVDYRQHPECTGCQFEIKRTDRGQHTYSFHTRVVNNLAWHLEYDQNSHTWKASQGISTMMSGPPAEMRKETIVNTFMLEIERLDVDEQGHLIMRINQDEQIRLERFTGSTPGTVTENIFN
jgi:hypothetical protein